MRTFLIGALALIPSIATAADDVTLFRYRGLPLETSVFGPIAKFQAGLNQVLATCPPPNTPVVEDGSFGAGTVGAIKRVVACHPFDPPLPENSEALRGAITQALWDRVLPNAAQPNADARAQALTLVFEATSYTALEFNYCQSRSPVTNKTWDEGDSQCYSNDPCSFATWGPRGATIGGGHEIQTILWQVDKEQPGALSKAFGTEAPTISRLLKGDHESAEVIGCAAFVDRSRRAVWHSAFETLGKETKVQSTYDQVYRSLSADGAKMTLFYRLYQDLKPLIGRDPTEIDYAFFLDRSTHGGFPREDKLKDLGKQLAAFVKSQTSLPSPAQLRWQLAQLLPVSNQVEDRLGRDVVYLYDGLGAKVGKQAINAWNQRGPYLASDFGLSDDRSTPTFVASPAKGYENVKKDDEALPADRASCPAVVLRPLNPASGHPVICSAHPPGN